MTSALKGRTLLSASVWRHYDEFQRYRAQHLALKPLEFTYYFLYKVHVSAKSTINQVTNQLKWLTTGKRKSTSLGLFGHCCVWPHCWPHWQTPRFYLGFSLSERSFLVTLGHDWHAKLLQLNNLHTYWEENFSWTAFWGSNPEWRDGQTDNIFT